MLKSHSELGFTADFGLKNSYRRSGGFVQKLVGKEFFPKSEGESVSIPERHSSSKYSAELRFFPTSIYYLLIFPTTSHKIRATH